MINIDVILIKDIEKLGKIGDMCRVKPGYARNFLFPEELALPMSKRRLKEFEHKKKIIAHKLLKLKNESEKLKLKIEKIDLNINAKVGENGKIFGSIGSRIIASSLKQEGIDIEHKNIKIDSPIKNIGQHIVEIKLKTNIKSKLKIMIIDEKVN